MGVSLLVNFIMRFLFSEEGSRENTYDFSGKHVRLFRLENMYVFSGKDHSVFGVLIINVLYTVSFLRAYCTEFYWGSLYSSLAKTDG